MHFEKLNRRRFLTWLAGTGVTVPFLSLGPEGEATTTAPPRRPLVVTSKTNPAVREEITTTAWNVLQDGGSAMDAAEQATNVSERDPKDPTV